MRHQAIALQLPFADEPPPAPPARPPAPPPRVAEPEPPRRPDVERALALLRRAVADCGYSAETLEPAIGKGRAHIHQVLHGRRPMSLRFFFALPEEVATRFEQLRSAHVGLIMTKPPDAEESGVDLATRLRQHIGRSTRRRATLRRYLATWSDGVTRIIHARRIESARALAAELEVPDSVFVRSVRKL